MVSRPESRGLGLALRRVSSIVAFAVAPVLVNLIVLGSTFHKHTFLFDFHGDLYSAGRAILHGHDPYRAAFLSRLAAIAGAGGHPSTTFAVPVYPAPALIASVPLALLPYHVAGVLFTLLAVGAFCLGLRLLGVRDWRCYGIAFLSWPLLHSLRLGQVNEFLVLAAGVAWRWRAGILRPAAALAAGVVAKLLLWPLAVFFVFTRRWRAVGMAALLAVIAVVACWAVIGFDGFTGYPKMLSNLSSVEGAAGVSFRSLAAAVGLGHGWGDGAAVVLTVGLLVLSWLCIRRLDDERRAFGLAVLAGLTSSTLVWPHYLTLLFIPIALLAPTFGPLWAVPLLAYLAPVELTHRHLGDILPYLAIELIVGVWLCAPLLRPPRTNEGQAAGPKRIEAKGAAVRLATGLKSTSFRSVIAAQRPTKGPEHPH